MGTLKMKPFACLLLFATTFLALTVDSYEVNSKYLSYSPEEEARYQSNHAFLKNFIKEQRAGWPNGFPGELFRFPVQHWDFWLRMRETLTQLRERYEAHKARRTRVLQQMSAARAAELARKEATYAQEPIEMKKSTDGTEMDLDILNTESDVEPMVGQGQKVDDGSEQTHFLRSSRFPKF